MRLQRISRAKGAFEVADEIPVFTPAEGAAIEKGLGEVFDDPECPFSPRHYVELMTMSNAELGRRFKRALRDELYEAKRRKS